MEITESQIINEQINNAENKNSSTAKDQDRLLTVKNIKDVQIKMFDIVLQIKKGELLEILLRCCYVKAVAEEIIKFSLPYYKINESFIQSNRELPVLLYVIFNNSEETFKNLLKDVNIDVNVSCSQGHTPLHVAIHRGHKHLIKHLLEKKEIDVNKVNNKKDNLLSVAADKSDHETIILLLQQKNINVNSQNLNKDTALLVAVHRSHPGIVKSLLNVPTIDVNLGNSNGDNPLIVASFLGLIDIVKLLLDHKNINVNHTNNNGDNALMVAAYGNQIEVVNILILKAPNIKYDHKNIMGFSLYDFCNDDYNFGLKYDEVKTSLNNVIN